MKCVPKMLLTAAMAWAAQTPSFAAQTCQDGYQLRGDVCVSQKMSDYIACIEAIGGNKQEITSIINSKSKTIENGGASGKGSGVVISGSGAVQLNKETEQEIGNSLATKFFSGGAAECQKPLSDYMPTDPKRKYFADRLRSDLRTVQLFRHFPNTTSRPFDAAVCKDFDSTQSTSDISFVGEMMIVVDDEELSSERCLSGPMVWSYSTTKCIAKAADLDDAIQIWSPPEVRIACLTGTCIKCEVKSQWRNSTTPLTDEKREYEINYLRILVGGEEMVSRTDELTDFTRALARVLSGGSDEAFCKKYIDLCLLK